MSLEVRHYNSAESFLNENEEFMLKNESLNNLILGLSMRLKADPHCEINPLFFAVLKYNQVVGQAIQTNLDKPLAITQMLEDEIDCLVNYFKKNEIKIGGVVGSIKSSQYFSDTQTRELFEKIQRRQLKKRRTKRKDCSRQSGRSQPKKRR